ncbi:MAG: ABC transporter ATP-binding protein/permease [Desulfovibrio sp.]|nr:ABC transporter ATP-binding protein/permease [Desulfovibrio sp.]
MAKDKMAKAKVSTLKAFWHLFTGFWTSESKWYASGMLALLVALCAAKVYCVWKIPQWYGQFDSLIRSNNANALAKFIPSLQDLALLLGCFALVDGARGYVQQQLRLRWRVWMTNRFLTRWMSNRAYYRLQVMGSDADNPDQRISEDAGFFAKATLDLLVDFGVSVAIVVALLAGMLLSAGSQSLTLGTWTFTLGGLFCWGSLVFYGAGTWLAHLVGRKLIALKYEQRQREADFRFSMMRTRENSESIAFYGGEKIELEGSCRRFDGVIDNLRRLIDRKTFLRFYTTFFEQMAVFLPFLMMLPFVIVSGRIPAACLALLDSCKRIKDSFSCIVNSYETLAELTAIVRRLDSLDRSMNEAEALPGGAALAEGRPGVFETKELCVQLPSGRTVMANGSLALERGARMLVTGPSGCGKSTFLRTVSGIWPFGSGEVRKAPEERTLFLPQRPYLPLGSLRRALCYPLEPLPASEDERLKEVLRKVDLERLIPLLDQEDDWSRILSLGEQQRVAFARVLLVRPAWVFLDESTSALDERRERDMYQLLAAELPAAGVVSVGHRTTLYALHDRLMQLTGGSAWSIKALPCQTQAAPA